MTKDMMMMMMMMMMHYTNIVLCVFFVPFFSPTTKNYFFLFFFLSLSSNNSLSSRLVSSKISLIKVVLCVVFIKEIYIHNTLHYYTMGGVLSVPGGDGGPAVEDVVALAESNDVHAIPLPVNEVRLRRRRLLLLRRLFLIVTNVFIK